MSGKAQYKTCTCPDCGQTYAGNSGGHCRARYGGCCRTFTSTEAADRHRIGTFDVDRRCVEDMNNDWRTGKDGAPVRVPWRLTDRGWTEAQPMPRNAANAAPWRRETAS